MKSHFASPGRIFTIQFSVVTANTDKVNVTFATPILIYGIGSPTGSTSSTDVLFQDFQTNPAFNFSFVGGAALVANNAPYPIRINNGSYIQFTKPILGKQIQLSSPTTGTNRVIYLIYEFVPFRYIY